MSHLRLVPPLPETSAGAFVPAQRTPAEAREEALSFFQSASGLCLCRECTKARHPAFAAR